MSGYRKRLTERGKLTNWGQQREGHVRTRKETDRARCAHVLEMAKEGACQGTERNRPSEAHSRSRDGKGRGLSGHGKKQTERGALTFWRWQRKGLVRAWKKTDRARRAHVLEMAKEGACQGTERNRPSEARSRPGDGKGRDRRAHV